MHCSDNSCTAPRKSPYCFLPTPSYKSSIEKHKKETMLSIIGWLFKRAAKNTRDSAAKKEYERGLLL